MSSLSSSNGPQLSIQEYTIYLDSHNRQHQIFLDEESKNNPTNNITLPIPLPSGRLPAVEFRLGSIELPLSQYTIESLWQNVYFDEGLDLIITDVDSQSLLQFGILEANGNTILAELPPSTNPITSIANNGTTTPIFTTYFPHRLELRSLYNWGDPMKLIGTPITDPAVYEFTASNASLTIISPTQFQLNLSSAITFTTLGTIFGYVRAPTIPNPHILAQLITQGLEGRWKVTYNPVTSKFQVCWMGSGCDARTVTPAFLRIPSSNSLPSLMGFGTVDVLIPVPDPESKPPMSDLDLIRAKAGGDIPNPKELCLKAANCYRCNTHIQIDPGNYDAGSLGSNLNLQWNRFYFDQGCAKEPFHTESLVVSDRCGTCYTIPIATGKYCPETLASYLQTQLNSIVPGSPNFVVQWDENSGVFVFSADVMFGLEFDSSNADLAQRLGFLGICYRNTNRYESTRPIYFPRKGCCQSTIPTRCLNYNYIPVLLGTEQKYRIERCKPRCIEATGGPNPYSPPFTATNTGFTDNGNSTGTIVLPAAHGLNVHDIVAVTFPGAAVPPGEGPHYFEVIQVPDFQTIVVDTGSLDTTGLPANAPTCVCLDGPIVGNLYFGLSCVNSRYHSILPHILGFMEEDFIPDPQSPNTVWSAPSCFSLDWPSYLLMVVSEPVGATKNEHLWDEDSKAHVFGKIILYPQYRLERIFPIRMFLHDMKIINRMRIQLLNPDHSLYQLHGKDWSATIVFNILEEQGQMLAM